MKGSLRKQVRVYFLLPPLFFLLAWSGPAWAGSDWHWDGDFTAKEKAGLSAWIRAADSGVARLLGPIPDYAVHFSRKNDRGEPVPWAETNKGRGPRVFFQVDTGYPWAAFRDDWTASHELVHLLFPYLGEDSRWFAEGVASYLQFQAMYAGGTLTWTQSMDRLGARFRRASHLHRDSRVSIVSLSRNPRGRKSYVRYYWGGAAYFLHVDRRLQREKGTRLQRVIRDYVRCCYRPWGMDAEDMMRKLNALSNSEVFTDVYGELMRGSEFPPLESALDWLRENPPPLINSAT